jgi:hypothetical protein
MIVKFAEWHDILVEATGIGWSGIKIGRCVSLMEGTEVGGTYRVVKIVFHLNGATVKLNRVAQAPTRVITNVAIG